jgi:hypothetical protein
MLLVLCCLLAALAGATSTCPSRLFPSVASFSAGSAYPAPSTSVSCTSTTATVTSNDIPPYAFVAKTPNPLTAQTFTLSFTLSPVVQSPPATIVNVLGVLGVTTTGLEIFGPVQLCLLVVVAVLTRPAD